MSVAALYNVPETEAQLAEWSFVNAAAHRDIIRVVFERTGLQLDSFVLDPFNPNEPTSMEAWSYQHQVMHQQMDAILGIQGYDLTDVDFEHPAVMAGWIAAHAIEHVQAGQILNLG